MSSERLEWSEWLKLRDKLVSTGSKFIKEIETLSEELRHTKIDEDRWTPKEILSHIAGWEIEVVRQFNEFLINPDTDDEYDIDKFNQKSVETRKDIAWNEIIDELKSAQRELMNLLSNFTLENIKKEKRFTEWINVLVKHYEHHTNQLRLVI